MSEKRWLAGESLRDELAEIVAKEIKGWGIKQSDAAARIDLSQSETGKLTRGVYYGSIERLLGIAGRIGLSVEFRVERK